MPTHACKSFKRCAARLFIPPALPERLSCYAESSSSFHCHCHLPLRKGGSHRVRAAVKHSLFHGPARASHGKSDGSTLLCANSAHSTCAYGQWKNTFTDKTRLPVRGSCKAFRHIGICCALVHHMHNIHHQPPCAIPAYEALASCTCQPPSSGSIV